ncbi:MAG: hypothetical protein BWY91_02589 [bacterium ADurb.BinA028]|nr:MAG: hypothetical protein BWY91_02589 [bacterium ADurb.BinA028]
MQRHRRPGLVNSRNPLARNKIRKVVKRVDTQAEFVAQLLRASVGIEVGASTGLGEGSKNPVGHVRRHRPRIGLGGKQDPHPGRIRVLVEPGRLAHQHSLGMWLVWPAPRRTGPQLGMGFRTETHAGTRWFPRHTVAVIGESPATAPSRPARGRTVT